MTFAPFLSGPGDDSYRVPLELFRENRRKLADRLRLRLRLQRRLWREQQQRQGSEAESEESRNCDCNARRYIVILRGGKSPTRYDTDHEPVFRQESYFWWLTGVKEPDCSLVMVVDDEESENENESDSDTENSNYRYTYALFVPRLPASYATIMGKIRTLDEWKDLYGVDGGAHFADALEDFVDIESRLQVENGSQTNTRCKILLMNGPNTDSGAMYEAPTQSFSRLFSKGVDMNTDKDKDKDADANDVGREVEIQAATTATIDVDIDTTTLFPILADCRVLKSIPELALMEHVTMITSFAHAYVMRNVRPGMKEYQCESLFKHYAYYNYGSRLLAYTAICGCGPSSAVLHYGHTGEPNSGLIGEGDHCLFDMGAEYQCYASDVTCSFPANGTFSEKYKAVYESVLNAQRAVYAMMEPGVSWTDCHIAAELEIVKGLYAIGVVQLAGDGDNGSDSDSDSKTNVARLLERLVIDHRLGAVFMPHGLGHLIGIDTHDVGGYLEGGPPRSAKAGLKSLRTARILEENMVLTVEPGCYFIDHLLDEALEEGHPLSPFLNKDLIDREYRGYGGVRLEDVVVVLSANANENGNGKDNHKGARGHSCIRNFTLCPRTVKEIEAVMGGGKWPPLVDEAPELQRLSLTKPWSVLPPPPSK